MKKLILIAVLAVSMASCVVVNGKPKNAPPGQVKKITGSKSAKPYAPGQTKKVTPAQQKKN